MATTPTPTPAPPDAARTTYHEAMQRRYPHRAGPKIAQFAIHAKRRHGALYRCARSLRAVRDFVGSQAAPLDGNCLLTLEGHANVVNCLAVLPGGVLASGSDDNTIKLWV